MTSAAGFSLFYFLGFSEKQIKMFWAFVNTKTTQKILVSYIKI